MMKKVFLKLKSLIKSKKVLGLALAGALTASGVFAGQKGVLETKSEVKTVKVEEGKVTQTISASGKIMAKTEAVLKFQTSGMLAWVGVAEGDEVKKWQAIAGLDKKELEKTFQKYANDYLDERWDFEQTQDDYYVTKESKLVTDTVQRVLDQAQYDLSNVVLDYELKDLAVKYATIYSPIAGIVTKVESPVAGVNVTAATAEFTVSDPDSVIFEANIDEVDVGQVKPHQTGTLLLDAYLDEEIAVEVQKIDFSATGTSGGGTAFKVEFSLPGNADRRFRLGMNGDVEIILAEKEKVLLAPISSTFRRSGKEYVWVIENDLIIKREVIVGLEGDSNVEIVEGLSAGEKIIKEGVSKIKEGEKVNQETQ